MSIFRGGGGDRTLGITAAAPAFPARRRRRGRLNWTAASMLAPAVIALLAIGIYPLIRAVNTSFREFVVRNAAQGTPYVGFENYQTVLTDGLFWSSLGRTGLMFLYAVPLQVVLGVAVAALLTSTRWRGLAALTRVLLVVPIATTPTVVGLIGRLVYDQEFGVLNWAIGLVGLGPVSWTGNPNVVLFTLALTDTWQWMPFVALVALAGLTAVPQDIIEASKLETNSWWETFRGVQLPYLLPGLTAVLIIRTADILKLFDTVFVLTRGGPGVSSELVSLYVQRVGFRFFDLGLASAQAILLLILCIVLSRLYIKLFYREIDA
jgi:multiple sugar transport system permease protein